MDQHFYSILQVGEQTHWSKKVISQLDKDISGGAITVKIWKNIGMTVRDRSGKFIMVDDPGSGSGVLNSLKVRDFQLPVILVNQETAGFPLIR